MCDSFDFVHSHSGCDLILYELDFLLTVSEAELYIIKHTINHRGQKYLLLKLKCYPTTGFYDSSKTVPYIKHLTSKIHRLYDKSIELIEYA